MHKAWLLMHEAWLLTHERHGQRMRHGCSHMRGMAAHTWCVAQRQGTLFQTAADAGGACLHAHVRAHACVPAHRVPHMQMHARASAHVCASACTQAHERSDAEHALRRVFLACAVTQGRHATPRRAPLPIIRLMLASSNGVQRTSTSGALPLWHMPLLATLWCAMSHAMSNAMSHGPCSPSRGV